MTKQLIEQYHCHYQELEEYHLGMWRRISGEDFYEKRATAKNLMADTTKFAAAMSRVIEEWPNSVRKNFTDPSINPVSWLGQAAVCLEVGASEGYTRSAWVDLPEDARRKSCSIAKRYIDEWRENYIGQGGLFDVSL